VPLIAARLLERINRDFARQEPGYRPRRLSDAAVEFIRRHAWPGNVRQLGNALTQAAVMTDGEVIERDAVEDALAEFGRGGAAEPREPPLGDGFSLERHLEEVQRRYLRRAMEQAGGVKRRAAELLGYRHYQTLAAQLERLGVG
jgi:DNA-binding NtrC family response regulator